MDPTQLSAAEAGRAIAGGSLSPVALTEAYLDRIAALDGELHSYVLVLRDEALDAAREAEREIRDGRVARPAARRPDRSQGHLQDERHPHDGRVARLSRPCAGRGRRELGAAARGRHDPARQAGDARIRDRRPRFHIAVSAGAQPVEPGALPGRLVERHRGGGRRASVRRRDGVGYRRLDPRPGRLLRSDRAEADLRHGSAGAASFRCPTRSIIAGR